MSLFLWSALCFALVAFFALLALILRRWLQAHFIRRMLSKPARRPQSDSCRVLASLSTLPDRIDNLEATVRSLLGQTRPPDEIVLAVPDFSKRQNAAYVVPQYLQQFPVRILRCEKDWGPATKFIPIVQEELNAGRGNTRIMVVDDDRIYPPDALEIYLYHNDRLPDAALAFRGAPMPQSLKWTKPKLVLASKIRQPRRVAVIMGCGSYLIQPRFFDSALWDYSAAPASAFYMDDIWISGRLDQRGIEKYVVPASAMMRTVPQQRGTMTLDEVPNGRRRSNREVVRFFADTWNVFLPE